MQKRLNFIGVIIIMMTLLLSNATIGYASGKATLTAQLVVKLNPVTGVTIDAINATYGTTTIKSLPNTPLSIY